MALAGHPARQVREPGPGFSNGHPARAKRHRHPCRCPLRDLSSPTHRRTRAPVEQRAIVARTFQKSLSKAKPERPTTDGIPLMSKANHRSDHHMIWNVRFRPEADISDQRLPNLVDLVRRKRSDFNRGRAVISLDDVLEQWIPYRLQAIKTFQFAWNWVGDSDGQRELHVVMGDRTVIQGNVAALANPMLEIGLIHARALLEFLGLCTVKGRLAQVQNRRHGDITIEGYSTLECPLVMVSPSEALAIYEGPREEAESALISIFETANKLVGHITDGAFSQVWTDRHLDIACRGIPALLQAYLYSKLGRDVPDPPIGVRALQSH